MKETYKRPELLVFTIKKFNILAGSYNINNNTEATKNGDGTYGMGKGGFGGWDDEEPGEDY